LKTTEAFIDQKTESYKNAEGKIVQKDDYLYTQPLSTAFKYNSIGELIAVQDPEGMVTRYSYNLAGKRTEQRHPDKGTTTYQYDQAGNLSRMTTDNLLNDTTISSNYIEYLYSYNRLEKIILPDLPNGNSNPNNISYSYGLSTAGNNAGRMTAKYDGSGDTYYKYGRMGEVISETRTVRGQHIPEMYFKTYFNYDSWNRITKIKYPDDEIVSYHYDKGGNLKSVNNNYGETLIENITYDYYGQRLKLKNGNGATQYYGYNYQNRRLNNYYLLNNSNQMMLNNTYKYDQYSNIIMIQNQAEPLANGLGGAYQFNLNYDTLNRLIGTETAQVIIRDKEEQPMPITSYVPSTYNLRMEYNGSGGIVKKRQYHERDQNVVPENTYDNKYEYISETHKVSVVNDTQTGNYDAFEYDYNGNAIIHGDANGTRRMFWDEQDRLRAFYNEGNGIYQYYTYDDKGERVIKYGLEMPTQLYQNGVPVEINELKLFEYKLYPNPYVTVSSTGQYTKHYFEGSRRFASRLMDGANRFEDPAVLYTNRKADDKLAEKPADVKSDFEKYLDKSGLGDQVSIELRERPWQTGLYYLHGDHLGTATFVTNSQSEATQYFVNLPFGETMYERMDGSYDNPYKFNAKELDEDSGLYYYGARYYNPRLSIWYGVDPLAVFNPVRESQFYGDGEHNGGVYFWGNLNPYIYTYQNPIAYIDPNGKQVKVTDMSYSSLEKNYNSNGEEILKREKSLNFLANRGTNTCAIKLSDAANQSGYPIPKSSKTPNNVRVQTGKKNDSGNFVLDAASMANYLKSIEKPTETYTIKSSKGVDIMIADLRKKYDDMKGIIVYVADDPKSYGATGHADLIHEDMFWDLSFYSGKDVDSHLKDNVLPKTTIKVYIWVQEYDK
jgi:RHS repeat-associated protein